MILLTCPELRHLHVACNALVSWEFQSLNSAKIKPNRRTKESSFFIQLTPFVHLQVAFSPRSLHI